ncbi:MAG: energy transducer TonB [Prevotellaceae bacterium]|jgi:protein TonB|nr:energy transducer TonB [Prevotellaceae bacterium]
MKTKPIFPLILVLFLGINVFAQQSRDTLVLKGENNLDTMLISPQFPGGEEAMLSFIRGHIIYPEKCRMKVIQGRVEVVFIIETTGELSDIKIWKSVHPLLDAEALRVIKLMPKWLPGKQQLSDEEFKPVKSRMIIPITFRLGENSLINNNIVIRKTNTNR